MILDFGAKNFFSFKEGFDISFRLGNSCPSDISNGKQFTNILCVKGANGSGKTNILKAINFISSFIVNSFDNKVDSLLQFDPYFTSQESTEFYVSFVIDNVEYRYEAELKDTEVVSEVMFRKNKRDTKIFERKDNKIVFSIKEFEALKKMPKLRKNVSVISMANQFDIKCTSKIHRKFMSVVTNVRYTGLIQDTHEISFIHEFYYHNPDYFNFAKELIIKFDPSIYDIYIKENADEDGVKRYTAWFVFEFEGGMDVLTLNHQSSGTKSLYKQLGSYKAVLDIGGLLVLDEFDINLHPHILPHLLDVFTDSELNTRNAQLIFTTHNTDILDYLGKHRSYLVNKEKTESYCYRLDEIPSDVLRNDRPISPAYNQGKIGGVPKL